MEAWIKRSPEQRHEEARKRNGLVARPMNAFMLYRSAYANRTKAWALQNNHQVVSTLSGESWLMEGEEIRNKYQELAELERQRHKAAFPGYKFSPSKNLKRKKRHGSNGTVDGEEEHSALDNIELEFKDGLPMKEQSPRRRKKIAGRIEIQQTTN